MAPNKDAADSLRFLDALRDEQQLAGTVRTFSHAASLANHGTILRMAPTTPRLLDILASPWYYVLIYRTVLYRYLACLPSQYGNVLGKHFIGGPLSVRKLYQMIFIMSWASLSTPTFNRKYNPLLARHRNDTLSAIYGKESTSQPRSAALTAQKT